MHIPQIHQKFFPFTVSKGVEGKIPFALRMAQRWPPLHDGNRSQPHLELSKAEQFSDQLDKLIPVMRQRMGGKHLGAWASQPHQELQSSPSTRNCRWHNIRACGPCGMNPSFLHTQILFVVPLYSFHSFLCWAFVHYMVWSWRALGSGYLVSWSSTPTGVFTDFFVIETSHAHQFFHLDTPVVCMSWLISSLAHWWGHGPQGSGHLQAVRRENAVPYSESFFCPSPATWLHIVKVGTLHILPWNHVERNPLLPPGWDLGPDNSVIAFHLTLCEPRQLTEGWPVPHLPVAFPRVPCLNTVLTLNRVLTLNSVLTLGTQMESGV